MGVETENLLIGEVARRAGVNVTTIRYYVRQELLSVPERRESGYREFPTRVVAQVRFIRRAQELGFTLNEVRELLSLRDAPTRDCIAVHTAAESKLALIREKVRSLQRMEVALSELATACRDGSPFSPCPIIEALDQ